VFSPIIKKILVSEGIMYIESSSNNSTQMSKTGKFGKVKVETFRDKYRLRFSYLGKRYSLTTSDITDEGFKVSCAKAQEINSDILMERFDDTLAKYSPERAKALEILEISKKLTLTNVWDNYKKIKENVVMPSTKKCCWATTERCISSVNSSLLEIDKAPQFIAALLENYSAGTLRPVMGDINAAVNLAVNMKMIDSNPYSLVKLPKKIKKPIECYEDNEIKEILEAFYEDTYCSVYSSVKHSYYYYYVSVLALTFARPEEIIALTWNDLKTKGEKTYIVISKVYSKGFIQTSKTKEIRLFKCNDQLTKLLVEAPRIENEHNLMFPSIQGGYINHGNWSKRYWRPLINGLVKDGKIHKYLKPYVLRHSGITRLIRLGFDISTVASLAGNSTEMICKHYLAAHAEINLPSL
jgi:integrase